MNRRINRKNKVEPLKTIRSATELLYRSLFEIHYRQWVTWLNIPSNSQWFGYYVKKAGIEAIIFPFNCCPLQSSSGLFKKRA